MHPDAAARLLERIESRGLAGEITLRDVDHAIQSAAEAWLARESSPLYAMPIIEYGSQRWDEIIEEVLDSLALDYDEVYEVAL